MSTLSHRASYLDEGVEAVHEHGRLVRPRLPVAARVGSNDLDDHRQVGQEVRRHGRARINVRRRRELAAHGPSAVLRGAEERLVTLDAARLKETSLRKERHHRLFTIICVLRQCGDQVDVRKRTKLEQPLSCARAKLWLHVLPVENHA
eukprot:1747796-Pleurochrysis_carterae.AAC.4